MTHFKNKSESVLLRLLALTLLFWGASSARASDQTTLQPPTVWLQCNNEMNPSDVITGLRIGKSSQGFEFWLETRDRCEAYEANVDTRSERELRAAIDAWGSHGEWHSGPWQAHSSLGGLMTLQLDLTRVSGGQFRFYATVSFPRTSNLPEKETHLWCY